MKLNPFLFVLICAIYCSCLTQSSSGMCLNDASKDRSNEGLIFSKWTEGCLDAGAQVNLGNWILNPIYSNSTCGRETSIKWHMKTNEGLLVIKQEHFSGISGNTEELCVDCAQGLGNCLLISYACHGGANQQFFLQTHPNQNDYENERYYFSIHIRKFPSKCLTYEKNPRNLVKSLYPNGGNELNIEWHNSFRLDCCTGSARQSFYFSRN